MALSFEQQSLMNQINAYVADIQDAIKRALPGNRGLHEEFLVGTPKPATIADTVALGRRIEPLARENRSLLIGRGIDAAKLNHLSAMLANLERLSPSAPAEPEPARAEAPAPAADAAPEGRRSRKRRE